MQKLTGMIVFCMLDKPTDCYEKNKGKEWKCGIVVDEDTADAFNELYPKQSARKIKRTDFEEVYKTTPPEGDEKNLYVITLKKNVKLANGNDVPDKYRPRVYEQEGNSRNDVTFTKLPANGSYGSISIDHYENAEYGNVARLKNVLITEMIEYERTESNYEPGSEFDDEVEAPEVKKEEKKPSKPVKPAAKTAADKESPF